MGWGDATDGRLGRKVHVLQAGVSCRGGCEVCWGCCSYFIDSLLLRTSLGLPSTRLMFLQSLGCSGGLSGCQSTPVCLGKKWWPRNTWWHPHTHTHTDTLCTWFAAPFPLYTHFLETADAFYSSQDTLEDFLSVLRPPHHCLSSVLVLTVHRGVLGP